MKSKNGINSAKSKELHSQALYPLSSTFAFAQKHLHKNQKRFIKNQHLCTKCNLDEL